MISAEEKRKRATEYARLRRQQNQDVRAKHVASVIANTKKRCEKDPVFVAAQRVYKAEYHRKRSTDPEYVARRRENTKRLRGSSDYTEREKKVARVADRIRGSDPTRVVAKREQMRARSAKPDVRLKHRLVAQRRRARLCDACSPGVTPAEWETICAAYTNADQEIECAYCHKPCAATIDHVVPIARGGRDEPTNVVPCCRFCNTSKGARLLSEWHRAPSNLRSPCPQNNSQILRAG